MKFLTRFTILLVVLGIIYLWTRMAKKGPRLQVVTVQTAEVREEPRRTSITVDSFLHVQQLRKKQLRYFCNRYPELHRLNTSGSADYFLTGISVSHKLMTLYCKPEDVPIDGWDDFVIAMESRPDVTVKHPLPVDDSIDQLANYSTDTLTYLLRTYTKVLFVVDPFERLISLYMQGDAGEITFEEFIDDILLEESGVDGFSPNSVLSLCHPCLVQYDYIVIEDFLEAELQHLLRRIGLPESVTLPPIVQRNRITSRWLSNHLFRVLTEEQLRQLAKLYSWDFAAFPLRKSLLWNGTKAKNVT
ncbi:carbohydrate sulfotransferase 11-like [Leptodactylus fuscus]|uniref:carbohydrate sulfotransferase 11-like n=1 Tax=Leptodactylus fuscus TaxID=238119 RepID=UPI003F4EEE96